jgi:hypothetical protein
MYSIAKDLGYECLFTVVPGKVSKKSSNLTLSRYIILGTHDSVFENATRFPATANQVTSLGAMIQNTSKVVTPAAGSIIDNRLPLISVDLSTVELIDPASLIMRVSGFGNVPANFNPETKLFSWKTNRRLRKPTYDISVSWKLLNNTDYEKPMEWTFIINRRAAYLPQVKTSKKSIPTDESPSIQK